MGKRFEGTRMELKKTIIIIFMLVLAIMSTFNSFGLINYLTDIRFTQNVTALTNIY